MRTLRIAFLLLPLAWLLACGSNKSPYSAPANTSSGSGSGSGSNSGSGSGSGSTTGSGSGSGSNTGSGSGSNTAMYDFNGSWAAVTLLNASSFPVQSVGGSLQVNNGAVTGTLTAFSNYTSGNTNLCPAVTSGTSLTATGTLDSSHNLTLTFPIAGGTGTIMAALADNPTTFSFGTLQIAGGTCAMSEIPMEIEGMPTTAYTPPTPSPITAALSGTYSIYADFNPSSTSIPPVSGFGTTLQFSNGTVTGEILPYPITNTPCFSSLFSEGAIAATGTLDANNNLTLTVPLAGGTGTITATLQPDLQTFADGSFQISGGPCAMSSTPMTIAQIAPVTGSYTGTFNVPNGSTDIPVSGSTSVLTVDLTQSATSDAGGGYTVTGTYSITGGCSDSGTLVASTSMGGQLSGANNLTAGTANLSGTITPTASAILNVFFTSTKCTGQGDLVLQ